MVAAGFDSRQGTTTTEGEHPVIEFQRADWMRDANCRGMDPDFFHPNDAGYTEIARAFHPHALRVLGRVSPGR